MMDKTAQQAISEALSDPTESLGALSRIGVPAMPWWRRLLFKIPYKRTLRMQRYILKRLEQE